MKTLFLSFTLLFTTSIIWSQDNSWMTYDNKPKDSLTTLDTNAIVLNFDHPDGTISVQKDPRVQSLIDFIGTPKAPDPVLMKGYRVQIAFSQDKTKALQEKMRFQSSNDDYAAYTSYLAPNFRIRVGNFKTKLEAERLQNEILMNFPSAVVVNDLIELPNLDQCDGIQNDTINNEEKEQN